MDTIIFWNNSKHKASKLFKLIFRVHFHILNNLGNISDDWKKKQGSFLI